jgi:hypothetical protein
VLARYLVILPSDLQSCVVLVNQTGVSHLGFAYCTKTCSQAPWWNQDVSQNVAFDLDPRCFADGGIRCWSKMCCGTWLIHKYMCIYYICVYINTNIHMYIYTHMFESMNACLYLYKYIYMCIYMHCLNVYMYIYVYMYA